MLDLFAVADEIGKKVYGDSPWTVEKTLGTISDFTAEESKFGAINVKIAQGNRFMFISPMNENATPGKKVTIIQLRAKRDVCDKDGVVHYSAGQQTMKWQ